MFCRLLFLYFLFIINSVESFHWPRNCGIDSINTFVCLILFQFFFHSYVKISQSSFYFSSFTHAETLKKNEDKIEKANECNSRKSNGKKVRKTRFKNIFHCVMLHKMTNHIILNMQAYLLYLEVRS